MLPTNGYAFVSAEGIVVQMIEGRLSDSQLAQFERDYRILFGAERSVPVYEGTTVWIGGSYDAASGEFSPPPQPITEETTNGDAPIE